MPAHRLAILGSHVIPYRTPLYRLLASRSDLSVKVFYGDTYGVKPRYSEWGEREFRWAGDHLSGYESVFLENVAWRPHPSRFFGRINPGLRAELRAFGAEAIMVMGYAGLYQLHAIRTARRMGCGILFTADTNVNNEPAGLKGRLKRAVVSRIYRDVDQFLVTGTRNRQHLANYGISEDRMVQFPWSIDNAHFQSEARRLAPERLAIRSRWCIAENHTCVLFAGRLAPEKDVASLIEAAAGAGEVFVLIAGHGPLRAELEALAAARLPGRCRFLGFLNQDRLPEAYAAADLMALPSAREPWGLTCNEAMASGLPLLVSDRVGAGADLVVEGSTGWSYAYGNAAAMKEALKAAVLGVRTRPAEVRQAVLARIANYDYSAQASGMMEALSRL